MCAREGSVDGAGGGGCCTHREPGTFLFFGTGLTEPAAAVRCLGADAFLFAGCAACSPMRRRCCVQVWARRHEEGVGGGRISPSIGAATRVWRMRQRFDGGSASGWNRVGRGRWGAGGCAGGRTEVGIWRWSNPTRPKLSW
jgi:hypothetical protein